MTKREQNLIKYLRSYTVATARVDDLKARLQRLQMVLSDSYHGVVIDGLPHGSNAGDGMDKVVMAIDKVDELTKEIERQTQEARDYAKDIIGVISLLPEGTEGRRILELKFIDDLSADDITYRLHVSIATQWRIYYRAISDLAAIPSVTALLEQIEKAER